MSQTEHLQIADDFPASLESEMLPATADDEGNEERKGCQPTPPPQTCPQRCPELLTKQEPEIP
eukprot:CAMPEP_0179003872 /NCGR_PEP_ID=MMETSP0795-20121207/12948_1 /TAXON_ID=88552 /ORGANISM="Amoebophrya sp., Strain Ameob2" /LENGTH=62 /DNA_ID=CAMNT_0020697987 /DNA_START=74 /DNA_END=262 /DNA_ORIENTATION=+